MTKEEAIKAMISGKKVRHSYFSKDEWMTICGDKYCFEDECSCLPYEFWLPRDMEHWNDGWSIVSE